MIFVTDGRFFWRMEDLSCVQMMKANGRVGRVGRVLCPNDDYPVSKWWLPVSKWWVSCVQMMIILTDGRFCDRWKMRSCVQMMKVCDMIRVIEVNEECHMAQALFINLPEELGRVLVLYWRVRRVHVPYWRDKSQNLSILYQITFSNIHSSIWHRLSASSFSLSHSSICHRLSSSSLSLSPSSIWHSLILSLFNHVKSL